MPINDNYKIIFVHIPKNGGTTVEYLLGMHGELETVGIVPYRNQVQNEYLFGDGAQEFTASEIATHIGQAKFNEYTKFCISRNPYARLVSFVAWSKELRPHATDRLLTQDEFDLAMDSLYQEYRQNRFDNLYLKPQYSYICDNDHNVKVDRVFRLEQFDEVLDFIAGITNKPIEDREHRMRSNHQGYQAYMTGKAIRQINEMYARDFQIFNYETL